MGGRAAPPAQEWRRVSASVGLHAPAAEWEIATLDRILVACAEHELNASTFAARVVASTGADLYASVLAALCSLSGPIHGGACDRIEQMFARNRRGDAAGANVSRRSASSGGCRPASVMRSIRPAIRAQCCSRGRPPRSRAIAAAACSRPRSGSRKRYGRRERLRPNLDFYLTVCARMLGFARGLPAAIFAVGRAAGWIAHSLEQYADNRLIRPRMRYRGVPMRHWT